MTAARTITTCGSARLPYPVVGRALLLLALLGTTFVWGLANDAWANGYLVPNATSRRGARNWKITRFEWRTSVDPKGAHHVLQVRIANDSDADIDLTWAFPLVAGVKETAVGMLSGRDRIDGQLLKGDALWAVIREEIRGPRGVDVLPHVGIAQVRFNGLIVNARSSREFTLSYSADLTDVRQGPGLSIPTSLSMPDEVPVTDRSITIHFHSMMKVRNIYSVNAELSMSRGGSGSTTATVSRWPSDPRESIRIHWSQSSLPASFSLLTSWPRGQPAGYFALLGSADMDAHEGAAHPQDVMFVLDESSSLRGPAFERIRHAVSALVRRLPSTWRANAVVFSSGVQASWENSRLLSASNKRELLSFLAQRKPERGSDLHQAVWGALTRAVAGGPRSQTMILVTDGRPASPDRSLQQLMGPLLQARNTCGMRFFALGLGLDVDSVWLDALTLAGGGDTTYVSQASGLKEGLRRVFARATRTVGRNIQLDLSRLGATQVIRPPSAIGATSVVAVGRFVRPGARDVSVTIGKGDRATTYHAVVHAGGHGVDADDTAERLWKEARAAQLIDALRRVPRTQAEAATRVNASEADAAPKDGAQRLRYVDELVRLGVESGVLTEATGFLETDRSADPGSFNQNRETALELVQAQAESPVGRLAWTLAAGNAERRRHSLLRPTSIWVLEDPGRRVRLHEVTAVRRRGGRAHFLRDVAQELIWVDGTRSTISWADDFVDRNSNRFAAIVRMASPAARERLALPGQAFVVVNTGDREQLVHVHD